MPISLHHTPLIMAAATTGSSRLGASGLNRALSELRFSNNLDLLTGLHFENIAAAFRRESLVDPLKSIIAAENLEADIQNLSDPEEQLLALLTIAHAIGDKHFPSDIALSILNHLSFMLHPFRNRNERVFGDVQDAKRKLDELLQSRPPEQIGNARYFGEAPKPKRETPSPKQALARVEKPQVPEKVSRPGIMERFRNPSESAQVLLIRSKSLYRIWSRPIDYLFERKGQWTRYSEFWRVDRSKVPKLAGLPNEKLWACAMIGELEEGLAAIKIMSWRAERGDAKAERYLADLKVKNLSRQIREAAADDDRIRFNTLIMTLHKLIEQWGSWRAALAYRNLRKSDPELPYMEHHYYYYRAPEPTKLLERIEAGEYPNDPDVKSAFDFMIQPNPGAQGYFDIKRLAEIIRSESFPRWAREIAVRTLLANEPKVAQDDDLQPAMRHLIIRGDTSFQSMVASLLTAEPDPALENVSYQKRVILWELVVVSEIVKIGLYAAIASAKALEREANKYTYRDAPASEWPAIDKIRGYYNLALLRRTFEPKSARLSMYERGGIETVPPQQGEQQRRTIYSWVNKETLLIEAIGKNCPEEEDLIGVRWDLVNNSPTSTESQSFRIIDAHMHPDDVTSQNAFYGIRRALLEQLHRQILHFDQRDERSV